MVTASSRLSNKLPSSDNSAGWDYTPGSNQTKLSSGTEMTLTPFQLNFSLTNHELKYICSKEWGSRQVMSRANL